MRMQHGINPLSAVVQRTRATALAPNLTESKTNRFFRDTTFFPFSLFDETEARLHTFSVFLAEISRDFWEKSFEKRLEHILKPLRKDTKIKNYYRETMATLRLAYETLPTADR